MVNLYVHVQPSNSQFVIEKIATTANVAGVGVRGGGNVLPLKKGNCKMSYYYKVCYHNEIVSFI